MLYFCIVYKPFSAPPSCTSTWLDVLCFLAQFLRHPRTLVPRASPAPAPPHLNLEGTTNVITAMKEKGVSRVAAMTSIGAGDSEKQAPFFFKVWRQPFVTCKLFLICVRSTAVPKGAWGHPMW